MQMIPFCLRLWEAASNKKIDRLKTSLAKEIITSICSALFLFMNTDSRLKCSFKADNII